MQQQSAPRTKKIAIAPLALASIILLMIAALFMHGNARADTIEKADTSAWTGTYCTTQSNWACAVRFTMTATSSLDSLSLYMQYFDSPLKTDISYGDIALVDAYGSDPTVPGYNFFGTTYCEHVFEPTALGDANTWVQFSFDCSASLDPGTYWIILYDSSGNDSSYNFFQVATIADVSGDFAYAYSHDGEGNWSTLNVDTNKRLLFNIYDTLDPTPTPSPTPTVAATATPTPTGYVVQASQESYTAAQQLFNTVSGQAMPASVHAGATLHSIKIRIYATTIGDEDIYLDIRPLSGSYPNQTVGAALCTTTTYNVNTMVGISTDSVDGAYWEFVFPTPCDLTGQNDIEIWAHDTSHNPTYVRWFYDASDVVSGNRMIGAGGTSSGSTGDFTYILYTSTLEPTPTPTPTATPIFSTPTATPTPTPTPNPKPFTADTFECVPDLEATLASVCTGPNYTASIPLYTVWKGVSLFDYTFIMDISTATFDMSVRTLDSNANPTGELYSTTIHDLDTANLNTSLWPVGPIDMYNETTGERIALFYVQDYPGDGLFDDADYRCAAECAVSLHAVDATGIVPNPVAGTTMYRPSSSTALANISVRRGDNFAIDIAYASDIDYENARLVIASVADFSYIVDIPLASIANDYAIGSYVSSVQKARTFEMHFSTTGTRIPWIPVYDLVDMYNGAIFAPGAYQYALTDASYNPVAYGDSLLIVTSTTASPVSMGVQRKAELNGTIKATMSYDTAQLCSDFSNVFGEAYQTGYPDDTDIGLVLSAAGECGKQSILTYDMPASSTLTLPAGMTFAMTLFPTLLPLGGNVGYYPLYLTKTFQFVESCGIECTIIPGGFPETTTGQRTFFIFVLCMAIVLFGLSQGWNIFGIGLLLALVLGYSTYKEWVSPMFTLTVYVVAGALFLVFGIGRRSRSGDDTGA